MKCFQLFAYVLLSLLCINGFAGQNSSNNQVNPADERNIIKIRTSAELNHLTADWINEYEKLNPGIRFAVDTMNGNEINTNGNLIFISSEYRTNSYNWKISIGSDVIVPVLNAKNPMFKEIAGRGISSSEFAIIYSGSGIVNWSDLIKRGANEPVNQYIIDNDKVKAGVADFIQKDPAALHARLVGSAKDLIAVIQKDPYAIGFCRLSDVRRENADGLDENIRLLPIDKNGNGRLDNFERIFNSPDDLSRGVWIGKYPHALSGSIYALSQAMPTDKNTLAFLSWIVKDGGKSLISNGYGDLLSLEKQAGLAFLSGNQGNDATKSTHGSGLGFLVMVLVSISVLIVLAIIFIFTKPASMANDQVFVPVPALRDTVTSPEGLYYDKTHTWAFMERDGLVRLGIDDFLQHVTGTITRITMKEDGEFIRRGEKILTVIKFGKQLSLYSPVSGTIKARNMKLDENSCLINKSPYGEGWVYLVEPKNWLRELQFMWMGEKHREWLKDEFIRLRNFFENTLKVNHNQFEYSLLQDGGELRDNLLSEMGPEVWEEFQRKFIDTSR